MVGFDQEEEKGDCGNFKIQTRVWQFPRSGTRKDKKIPQKSKKEKKERRGGTILPPDGFRMKYSQKECNPKDHQPRQENLNEPRTKKL